MAFTGQYYNHTLSLFESGANGAGDTYKLMLLTDAATFDATDTVIADVSAAEVSGGGWAAGGYTLTNVAYTVIDTDSVKFTSDNVSQLLSGASLANVKKAVIHNSTDNKLLFFYTSDTTLTIPDGNTVAINVPANGWHNVTPA